MKHKLPQSLASLLDELHAARLEQNIEDRLGPIRTKRMTNASRGPSGYTLMEKYNLFAKLPMNDARDLVFEGISAASDSDRK